MNTIDCRTARIKLDLPETGCAAADAHLKKLGETLRESAERIAREYESAASSYGVYNRLRMHTLRCSMRVRSEIVGSKLTLRISAVIRCGEKCETVELTELWDTAAGKLLSLQNRSIQDGKKT